MLETIALGILIFAAITLFYGIIMIHDIPYDIARKRNHPQQDAIHTAGWISLLTLHVLWPFLWIWATLYREDRGWGFSDKQAQENNNDNSMQLIKLQNRVEALEAALKQQQAVITTKEYTSSETIEPSGESIIAEQQGDK
ncbi:DUF3302 domain-containing protein [Psychromonas sp. RZ22]|nr:DUF3302 domain-containing protein [Psychromonas sp. RZ22]